MSDPAVNPDPRMPGPGFIPGTLHLNSQIAPQVPQGAARPFAPGEWIDNPGGGWSSEETMTVPRGDGQWINVPSLWLKDGKPYVAANPAEALALAKASGLNFQAYPSSDTANTAATQRETNWNKMGDPQTWGKTNPAANVPSLWAPSAPGTQSPFPRGTNAAPQTSTESPLGALRVAGNVDLKDENARFVGQVRQALADAPPNVIANTQVISGYRSPEQQAEIYNRHVQQYGSGNVYGHQAARPGHSEHNVGLAMDLKFSSPDAQQWWYSNAKNYGLSFPIAGDIGHMEPVWARAGGAPTSLTAGLSRSAAPQQQAGSQIEAQTPAAPAASSMSPELRQALLAPAPAVATEPQTPAAQPASPVHRTITSPPPGQPATAYRDAMAAIAARKSANPFA